MRRVGWALACGGLAVLCLGCQSSCEKLAKAVCERGVDPRICAESTALASSADQAARTRCRVSIKALDQYVLDRQMALKLRDMFERFEKSPPSAPPSAAATGVYGAGGAPDAGAPDAGVP